MSDQKIAPFKTVAIFDDIPDIKHGFFTRQGGVSDGIFDSLNTGRGSTDNPAYVLENIEIICASMGISPDHLQTLYQIHSNTVHTIHDVSTLPNGDGLITDKAHIALGIKTADCVPILFACAKTKIIGACHAGWGGDFKGIAQNTVKSMVELGANASSIHTVIGPCLHQENFEVGAEFVEQFTNQSPDNKYFFTIPNGKKKYHFDLVSYLKKQLHHIGIVKVGVIDIDTYSNPDLFFSYRRSCHKGEHDYGRQLSVIVRTA